MPSQSSSPVSRIEPTLITALGRYAILGCAIFAISILIADFVVPKHDWVADTISDLGAGRYEFIVDIGIYAFSASLISIAILAAHVHLGGLHWSMGIIGLMALGLLVFLVGARNEYGDNDTEGFVIHRYLVYGISALTSLVPFLMSSGAARIARAYRPTLIGIAIVWAVCAPVFFFLPDNVDGIYERFLGTIVVVLICVLVKLFFTVRDTHSDE